MEKLIEAMKHFGFTEMETKVYIALIEYGPTTGYEISKMSGVARSKVYNVLEKLIKQGIVYINHAEQKLYGCLSTDELLDRLSIQSQDNFNYIENYLGKLKEKKEDFELWKLDNEEIIFDKFKHLVKSAKKSILIQIWEDDLSNELLNLLIKAEKRVEQFALIFFSEKHNYKLPLNNYYVHGFESQKLVDMGGRWINLVVDDTNVLFGTIQNEHNVIWTHHPAMLTLAKEYIKHDAYNLKIIKDYRASLQERYGENLELIRNIYN